MKLIILVLLIIQIGNPAFASEVDVTRICDSHDSTYSEMEICRVYGGIKTAVGAFQTKVTKNDIAKYSFLALGLIQKSSIEYRLNNNMVANFNKSGVEIKFAMEF